MAQSFRTLTQGVRHCAKSGPHLSRGATCLFGSRPYPSRIPSLTLSGLASRTASTSSGHKLTRHSFSTARNVTVRAAGDGGGGGGSFAGRGGGGGGGGGAGAAGLWAAYLRLLEDSPLLTKACTAGLLNGLGDFVSQKFVEKHHSFDWKRLGIFTLLGSVLVGPGLHFWYGFIGRTVTATGTTGALIRLALDQLLWAPVFISTFLASLLTLEGKSHQIKSKLKNDLKPTVIANWKLWVPAQFINFRLVPPHLQVAFSNVVAVGWNTYLSWASHHSAAHDTPVGSTVTSSNSAF